MPLSIPSYATRLNPFNIREAGQTYPSTQHRRFLRLNPFNIREAGQTCKRIDRSSHQSLNPFNIREAGQTPRSKFVNADKHLQGCLETKRRSEKLTLGMGLIHGAV
ncbi:MAG: hypothetical protein RJB37_879 [Pseudomonadota bacterium]